MDRLTSVRGVQDKSDPEASSGQDHEQVWGALASLSGLQYRKTRILANSPNSRSISAVCQKGGNSEHPRTPAFGSSLCWLLNSSLGRAGPSKRCGFSKAANANLFVVDRWTKLDPGSMPGAVSGEEGDGGSFAVRGRPRMGSGLSYTSLGTDGEEKVVASTDRGGGFAAGDEVDAKRSGMRSSRAGVEGAKQRILTALLVSEEM